MVLIIKGVWEYMRTIPENGPEEKEYKKAQQLGLAEIFLACEGDQQQIISEAMDMTEAWQILARTHEAPSTANISTLEYEFITVKMIPGEPIQKFITRVRQRAQNLEAVGVKVEKARTANMILAGLPKDYLQCLPRPMHLWNWEM